MMKRIFQIGLSAAIGTMRALLIVSICSLPLLASQNPLGTSTVGPLSGLAAIQSINSAIDSLNTCNSGATAPTNQLSGSPSAGNCWYNTSTGAVSYYDGASWLPVGYIDPTNHLWTPVIGGNASTTVSSATTTNLCGSSGASPTGAYLTISGTTTITGFGSNCATGQVKILTFSGILTLTYNASSLIMPTSANITTAAGDIAIAISLGSGNWKLVYLPISGAALSTTGLNIGSSALANSALSFTVPINLQLNAATASNEITVSVCAINSGSNTCNNPSSSSPVLFSFPDATLANGDPTIISLQAALSFTTSATTNSFGCVTAVVCRLWVWAINNSGTIDLCVYNAEAQSTASIIDLNEAAAQSSASGTGGGVSNQTLYCNASSVSSKGVRRLGYVDATWTSGTGWTSITAVRLFGPGIKKPGEVLQHWVIQSTTQAEQTSVTLSVFNTSPALSQAVTPTASPNGFLVSVVGSSENVGGASPAMTISLARKIGAGSAAAIGITNQIANGLTVTAIPPLLDFPNTTSAVTYNIWGSVSSGDLYYPFGGVNSGITMDIQEIQA
jgi:hypothetical protein